VVVILVLYLVDKLPIDGHAEQIVRVIAIIIGIISLLKYLAVFWGLAASGRCCDIRPSDAATQNERDLAERQLIIRGKLFKQPGMWTRIQAANFRQLSAQRRQASAQSFISPIRSQSAAQCAQISAQKRQVRLWSSEPISMTCADVRQISAQTMIKLKCLGSVCWPPSSKQCPIAVDRHALGCMLARYIQHASFVSGVRHIARWPE
jgi:hypothetical protein